MLRTADSLDHLGSNQDTRASLYYSYALIFRDLGNADSAFVYMEKYNELAAQIAEFAAENKVEIARIRMANVENVNQIESLQKDKSRIKLIRNFSVALIALLAAFGYVYINRMRLKSRLKEQEAAEAKRKAENEAAHAKEQLNIFTESLREKTKLIEELQTRSEEKFINVNSWSKCRS